MGQEPHPKGCCTCDNMGECLWCKRERYNKLQAEFEKYGLGDRPSSPPVSMLRELLELQKLFWTR